MSLFGTWCQRTLEVIPPRERWQGVSVWVVRQQVWDDFAFCYELRFLPPLRRISKGLSRLSLELHPLAHRFQQAFFQLLLPLRQSNLFDWNKLQGFYHSSDFLF